MSKKLLQIDTDWANHPLVAENLVDILSTKQKALLTPVLINSNNVDGIRKSFVELYRKTNSLFSPLTFRYSFGVNISKKRNVTIVPLYYLEKDVNMMLNDYKIITHVEHIKPTGASWEEEVYAKLKYFAFDDCEKAVHKLIKTKDKNGIYRGWECEEMFKDNPVR